MRTVMQPSPLLLIKEQALVAHEAHYAGGIHLFNSLAVSLSQHFPVHVFTTARKSLLLHYALQHGLLGQLQASYQPSEVISWSSSHDLHYHVVILPESSAATSISEPPSAASVEACPAGPSTFLQDSIHSPLATLISATVAAAVDFVFKCRYILDVDTLQHATISSTPGADVSLTKFPETHQAAATHEQAYHNSQSPAATCHEQPFMLELLQRLQQQYQQYTQTGQQHPVPQLIALVQNIHHLPFGPCGTAPRTSGVLTAWQQVSSILCVSASVQSYLQQHVLPLIGMDSNKVQVFHPAAAGAFGTGPFADLGDTAADRLWGTSMSSTRQQQQAKTEQQQQQAAAPWHQRTVIGMLKCSREKGSDLLFGLAARLPDFQFLAVTADSAIQQQASTAAAAGLTNISLVSPVADVSQVLQQMSVVLVPSVLQEAFGLVVIDAILHGLPVIVSDAGALPEAAAGAAAAVVPVRLVQFPAVAAGAASAVTAVEDPASNSTAAAASDETLPVDSRRVSSTKQQEGLQQLLTSNIVQWQAGRCYWHDRVFPSLVESDYDPWIAALRHVLSNKDVYMECSRKGRAVGEGLLAAAGGQLQTLVDWLKSQ